MRPFKASDLLDAGTRSRSTSVSSDTHLTRVSLMSPPFVTPPPAFISSSAASEIITADQEFNAADFVAEDDEGASVGATAVVTPAALSLLNGFLDNILFNILGISKSTQLTCIRPAVTDVLKPRLAAEVVTAADDELSEYMGGAEDEEHEFRGGQEPGGDFDLIRSWKLTRLRCMVYTRLGDMEEDDEDEFIAQDSLGDSHGAPRRFSSHVDNITPAAAIFLTSIIEYIGERALVIAGETARSRLSVKLNDNGSEDADRTSIDRLVVEDLDMEKLALNATLGRLWRTWRKRRRGNTLSRTLSRDSFHRRRYTTMGASRKSSISTIEEPVTPRDISAESDPASIPLPMNDHDIQEIEIPGYKSDLDAEVQTMKAIVAHKVRPRSLMVLPSPLPPNSPLASKEPPSSNASPVDPTSPDQRKVIRHVRSRSLPSSTSSPVVQVTSGKESLKSPTSDKQQEAVEDDDESAEFVDAAESAPGLAISTPPAADEFTPAERQRMSVVPEEEEEATPHPDNLHGSDMVASLRSRDTGEPLSEVSSLNERDLRTSDQASISPISENGNDNSEIIEGRGTYEKPKQTATVQRPKRKSSRGITQPPPISAEAILPPTQGAETTHLANEAIKSSTDYDGMDGDVHKSPMMAALGHDRQPEEPRPDSTSSDYSQRSQSSRRHKPAPLIVTASNQSSSRRTDSSSSTATERAAVQRMPRASTSVPTTAVQVRPSRSESLNQRPMTANSTTSQVSTKLKGFISRQPGDSPSLRLRSSSDTSRASGDTGDSAADDGTDLDKLINSDETIHYTLTPRSVREMGFPDLPPKPIPRSDTAGTSDLADFLKNTGPPGNDMPRSRPSVSSKTNGDSPKYVPIASRMSTSSARGKAPVLARDARLGGDSTRDLAEFMKATGPIDGPTSAPLKHNIPKALPATPVSSNSNRPRLQARGADDVAGTSDLIDFIREGPPRPGGAHRIPRTVAPFRNTVDSDDLQLDQATRNSLASTQDSSVPSSGSRTALLDSASRLKGRMEYAAASKAAAQDAPAPVRRNRFQAAPDPYAIDDDEDDDLLEELLEAEEAAKPKRQEESLMDFLRDAPPPPSSDQPPQPLSINIPQNNNPSSHGFASDFKSRLLRSAGGDRTDRSPSTKLSRTSLRSQTSNYAAPPSNYTTKVGIERNAGTMPTMPSTSNRTTETGALADFLRNTGPPEPVSPRPSSSSMGNNMNQTFSRLFVRRKKVEA
ncbi:hypothetical protein N7510_009101 [Penicillium lagena]|uniref:uncharacterized protein n=1 Tax=Penicillium lagena TaxID=94218 RepID=UPI0025414B19|nr:uncharacterized protein N7510_009101 [Penicillium lagena]KAJ5606320.1 hypothetical protein N7510_009101 [Penicillium lagena]